MQSVLSRSSRAPLSGERAEQGSNESETKMAPQEALAHSEHVSTASPKDIYASVTARIVADLEQGVRPWLQPWKVEHSAGPITRPLRANGERYSGIHVLMLWHDAWAKGYASPIWMTFRQAAELDGHVRKGEHGSTVVYANRIKRIEIDDAGEEHDRSIPFLKAYTVFNAEQIEGLPAHFYASCISSLPISERIAHAELFSRATLADIRHGGNRAFYATESDHVQLPPFETFRHPESYYATLLHELTHWTRHESRLNRELGGKRWGDAGYAAEELVAELGAAFLCADLGITLEPLADHAAYIANWLEVLKNDKRAIFTAAALAQRAADFLHSLQPNPTG
jgi:antirestriction protein ArdC